MSMQSYDQLLKPVHDLLKRLDYCLEKGFPIIPNYLVTVKVKDVESIIDTLYGALPQEINDARAILRRREELQIEAQQKADKIVTEAQNKADQILSESDIIKTVKIEAEKIKEQVIAECEEIKRRALDDAENIRLQAADDAMQTRNGADLYVERIFSYLENTLSEQLQDIGNIYNKQLQVIKNGQEYMQKLKSDANSNFDPLKNNYPQAQNEYSNNFKLD